MIRFVSITTQRFSIKPNEVSVKNHLCVQTHSYGRTHAKHVSVFNRQRNITDGRLLASTAHKNSRREISAMKRGIHIIYVAATSSYTDFGNLTKSEYKGE